MISQTAEYALRAAACLAREPELRLTTPQIAARTHVPAGYLSKVLQALGRGGLVRSQRGLGGGFELTRQPSEISVLDVVNAVDPLPVITVCPLQLPEHEHALCPLHRKLREAQLVVQQTFAETTLDELVSPESKPQWP